MGIEKILEQEEEERRKHAIKAALSAAAAGGIYGGGFSILHGANTPQKMAMAALKTGLISGAMGGGGTYIGSHLLGNPAEEETTGYTRRSTLGGSILGGLTGVAGGALAGMGKFNSRRKAPNLIAGYFRNLGREASPVSVLKGAGVGGIGGALLGGYIGNDEGMVIDFLNQEAKQSQAIEDEQKKTLRNKYSGALSNG